ncbi:MAG: hypothetical protein KJS91_12930 [Planctomycetes bacterium]|nr:hypothetical protein [Planctomycetota bacterium]
MDCPGGDNPGRWRRKNPRLIWLRLVKKADESWRPPSNPRLNKTGDVPVLICDYQGNPEFASEKSQVWADFFVELEPIMKKQEFFAHFFWLARNFPHQGQNRHKSHDWNADSQG